MWYCCFVCGCGGRFCIDCWASVIPENTERQQYIKMMLAHPQRFHHGESNTPCPSTPLEISSGGRKQST